MTMKVDRADMAAMIDHTLLKGTATRGEIDALCREALEHRFASVCVSPRHVARAAELLRGSCVKVCTVIGFPLGANDPRTKAFEARTAVADGAQECDMVIDIGALKDGDVARVEADVRGVVEASGDAIVKVIIETCYLTDEEKVLACQAAARAGARFVKTSTGFGSGGATPEDVTLMRASIPEEMGVKASGGVRTYEDARAMIEAGASRIGTSSGVAIVGGATES